ncbi:MAG: hypothetical protein GXO14_06650 [Thermococci archaeon]|nr:hypothetical protein [Thermococci archaeon]
MPKYEMLRDLLNAALNISDDYVRTVTLAKAGCYLRDMNRDLFLEAFKAALKSLDAIASPVLRVQAMVSVAEEMNKAGLKESGGKLLYRAYEMAKLLPPPIRDSTLLDVTRAACTVGALPDALMYATDIEDHDLRMEALMSLIGSLIKAGDFRRLRNVLDMMDEPWKSRAAMEVLRAYLRREQFASVLSLFPYFEDPDLLRAAFREVGIHLREAGVPEGTYEKFIDAAKALADRDPDLVLTLLSTIASTGRVGIVLKTLADLGYPEEGILKVAAGIINNPDAIREFVGSLDVPQDKAEALYKLVMDALLSKEPSREYHPLVSMIGRRTESEETLVKVVRYLTKLGELGEAHGLASLIEDPRLRSLAFGSIALALIRRGQVSDAIDAVEEVKDRKWKSWLMSEIIIKVLQLYSGRDIKEDFEESSARQAKRWREDAEGGYNRRFGT